MRILKRELQLWRLRVETEDDLWTLARLARKGMSLGMLGERRDQTTGGEEGGRAKSAERKKMWIRLNIEHTEYQTFTELLRVHGTIDEAKFDIGLHHTHTIELRDEIELSFHKPFSESDEELLRLAERSNSNINVAMAVVEMDEIVLFTVTSRGLREGATWTMRGGGKRGDIRQSSKIAATFRASVIVALTDSIGDETPLIVCGPGHARDALMNDLRDAGETRFMKSIATSMAGRAGANEILREGLAGDLLNEYSITKETALLEEAWTRLSTTETVAYGKSSLSLAMKEGAIEMLLISADLLRNEDDKIDGVTWMEWVRGLSQIGAGMMQCSIDHDAGQQLEGFGGVVALLRYALER
ncbi:MAG: hypothetical protein CMA63_05525 [Euryarchaeota archaeon]|nr:hypothetical protein [Euryarchaeota archaeon]|tara:strand:- start:5470 stop:6540 length:1071 start_codon:yes stop_codon:yes gene_type:complete